MRARTVIAISTGCLLVVAIVIAMAALWKRSVPQYAGHSADYWLDCMLASTRGTKPEMPRDAYAAFRAMGTNAYPFLLEELVRPESRVAKWHTKLTEAAPKSMRGRLPSLKYNERATAAHMVLQNCDLTPIVPQMLAMFSDPDPQKCSAVASLFGPYITREHAPYAALIASRLRDTSSSTQWTLLSILEHIGRGASNAVPMIVPFLNNTNADLCAGAAHALWMITGDKTASVQVLEAQLANADLVYVSQSYSPLSMRYLQEMDPRSPAIIEYFRRGLNSKRRDIQINACKHVMEMGPRARATLDDLWTLMKTNDPKVKEAALRAIETVELKAE